VVNVFHRNNYGLSSSCSIKVDSDEIRKRKLRIDIYRKDSLSQRCVYCLPKKLILVSQKSVITRARSLNEQDLHENLAYFKVPPPVIESIRSKLTFKIFDKYANMLKGHDVQYEIQRSPKDSVQTDSVPSASMPPSIISLQTWKPNNIGHPKEKEKKGRVALREPMHLCTCVSEEGGDGEGAGEGGDASHVL
jgi:hypothetical protein